MAIHKHYDIAFLLNDGRVHVGRSSGNPRTYVMRHLEGTVPKTAGKITKVIGIQEVEFDTEDSIEWCDALQASLVTTED